MWSAWEKYQSLLYRSTMHAAPFLTEEYVWNEHSKHLIENIVSNVVERDTPVTLKIVDLPASLVDDFAREMVAKKKGQMAAKRKHSPWERMIEPDFQPPKAFGDPQFYVLVNKADAPSMSELWNGICAMCDVLPDGRDDGADTIFGTTVVANIVTPSKKYTTRDHWHAPPVINVHLYGSTKKTYVLRSPTKTFYAEIGAGCDANCIIFPSCMNHEITTEAVSVETSAATAENNVKNIYIGIGTYIVLKDHRFATYAIECLRNSISDPQWWRQIDQKSRKKATELSDAYISNITKSMHGPATAKGAEEEEEEWAGGAEGVAEGAEGVAEEVEGVAGEVEGVAEGAEGLQDNILHDLNNIPLEDFLPDTFVLDQDHPKCDSETCRIRTGGVSYFFGADIFVKKCHFCHRNVHPCCDDELITQNIETVQSIRVYQCLKCRELWYVESRKVYDTLRDS